MLGLLDEDVLELLAEASTNMILNTESEFLWKEPRESACVLRYPHDPGPDKLDNHRRKGEAGSDTRGEAAEPSYRLAAEPEAKDTQQDHSTVKSESGSDTKGKAAEPISRLAAELEVEDASGHSAKETPNGR